MYPHSIPTTKTNRKPVVNEEMFKKITDQHGYKRAHVPLVLWWNKLSWKFKNCNP